jgi:hypothetical protein
LSSHVAGIDRDIEQIFLNLPSYRLDALLIKYGRLYGEEALAYAKRTIPNWKSGKVQMSGVVAERLLNLIPPLLEASDRFELVRKLRAANLPKETRKVSCTTVNWRSVLKPVLVDLVETRRRFRLPEHLLKRVNWLAQGDVAAAQRILVMVEEDEARLRLEYLEREFRRIDDLVQQMKSTRAISHTIEIPQGTIVVTIALPPSGVWAWIHAFTSQYHGSRFSR